MFENARRSKQARNFTTNVPKILDLKSSSEQIFFRKLSLGALNHGIKIESEHTKKHEVRTELLFCLLNQFLFKVASYLLKKKKYGSPYSL